jgi:hypothetical protein
MPNPSLPLSCGAILYAFNPDGELGVILGDEYRGVNVSYLPFKGGVEEGETPEQAAIREVDEETCGLVKLDRINLEHKFTTKRKEYHIGLAEVPYNIVELFGDTVKMEQRATYKEKRNIKFFLIKELYRNHEIHPITKSSLLYYKNKLDAIARGAKFMQNFTHYCGVSLNSIKRCSEYSRTEKCTTSRSWRKEYVEIT